MLWKRRGEIQAGKTRLTGKYMHAVELKLLLQPGEYEIETREWSKIPENQKTWPG